MELVLHIFLIFFHLYHIYQTARHLYGYTGFLFRQMDNDDQYYTYYSWSGVEHHVISFLLRL